MDSAFTTFASSRFVDRAVVIAALRERAVQLRAQRAEVVAVYLFGSFANARATPRSDADIVVEVAGTDPALRQRVWKDAFAAFLDAPVPVDLFVIPSAQLAQGARTRRGIAGAVARQGMRLE
jgi:predicted nucleotidyltransferase